MASALSLKVRTGTLTVEQRDDAADVWRRWNESFALLPVERQRFHDAARFAARHELALRAGDALHLAVAAARGCTLVTLDERLAKAGREFGTPVTGRADLPGEGGNG